MRMTSKGQVTIPIELREQVGLLADVEVEFELDGPAVRIFPAKQPGPRSRGARLIARLRGTGDGTLSTDEIMALTRGPET
jgi:bifunctional DNA-binding transcriptional regulator/antitoxin component of YhaV-PrlF toxin-antitoxin module